MVSERVRIGIGFAVISLIWGSTWLGIKIGLGSLPPMYAVAIRFTLAAVIIYAVMRIRGERMPVDRNSVYLYLSVALISFSFPFALVYWAEQYIPSGLASVLFALNPFVVALGSHFLLKDERMTGFKLGGVSLGFLGLIVIFWADLRLGGSGAGPMVAVLVSTILQGISLVLVKKYGGRTSPMAITLGGMLFGICILYALAFAMEDISAVHLDLKGIGSILYLASFGSVVTFVIYYWLLKRVEAVYLSLVAFVTPVLAVILGTFLLDETFSPHMFSGAALVLCGILVANGKDMLSALRKRRSKPLLEFTDPG
jgi:drug/metabolite transporter (DMT)-like permease